MSEQKEAPGGEAHFSALIETLRTLGIGSENMKGMGTLIKSSVLDGRCNFADLIRVVENVEMCITDQEILTKNPELREVFIELTSFIQGVEFARRKLATAIEELDTSAGR